MNLPSPPPRKGPQLRPRRESMNPSLLIPPPPPQTSQRRQQSHKDKTKAKWSDNDMKDSIVAVDSGYSLKEILQAFSIPRSLIRDHYEGGVKGRKMDPKTVLNNEEDTLVKYMMEMIRLAHPLSVEDLKMKVAEICQQMIIPFRDGIPSKSWLKWFKKRHSTLVMRTPQGLDLNRARNLCPPIVQNYYENVEHLYKQGEYQPTYIWKIDESEANASRNGIGKVFAPKGIRSVHTTISNDKE